MKETIADNTLKSLRSVLFRELTDLRNGDSEASQSIAVSKLSSQIINSYKVEIEAVKVANELKDKNLAYAHTLTCIQTEDTQKIL